MPPSQPIFRFAPSPNGPLHLGHAYSALFTAHWARRLGGVMLLRVEDIDTARCRPEFAAAAIEDLRWLGLSWPEPVLYQSARFPAYAEAADRLRGMGLLYPCFCTRGAVAAAAVGTDPDGAPLYPGTCRGLAQEAAGARIAAGTPVQWRLDMGAALGRMPAPPVRETVPDPGVPATTRPTDPARWGDVVLVRKDTPTSYHLAVVVDDAHQGVTHVTRGMDLHAATDIHALLQALLGLPPPTYCHHELVRDEEMRKLSKSKGAPALRDLRAAGGTAAELRALLGFPAD